MQPQLGIAQMYWNSLSFLYVNVHFDKVYENEKFSELTTSQVYLKFFLKFFKFLRRKVPCSDKVTKHSSHFATSPPFTSHFVVFSFFVFSYHIDFMANCEADQLMCLLSVCHQSSTEMTVRWIRDDNSELHRFIHTRIS